MKHSAILLLSVMCMLFIVPSTFADWKKVGDKIQASGPAKELTFDREISKFQISVDEGTVIINSVWVRNGAERFEIRVGRAFSKGDKQDIEIGPKQKATGLRLGHSGGGTYNVWVK